MSPFKTGQPEPQPYTPIPPSPFSSNKTSHDEAETETFIPCPLDDPEKSPRHRHHRGGPSDRPWGWISSTVVLAALSITLLVKTHVLPPTPTPAPASPWGDYATGFTTDLEPSKHLARLRHYRFTGGLTLTDNKTLVRDIEPGQPQYVGKPNAEIDETWRKLMRGLEIVLEGEEAETIAGKTIEEPEGGKWRLSLDVYHSLHCVNELRKALDPLYYHPPSGPPAPYFQRIHIDHCVDYLRQVVQCQSDLTPLYYYWDAETKGVIPRFGGEHTCRDFSVVDEWALGRHSPQHFG